MILTPHLLIGAAIASKISNPFLALPLAFLSHYFIDLIPHKDYSIELIKRKQWSGTFLDFLKVFADMLSGFFIVLIFFNNNPIILIASFSAIIPDGITFLSIVLPKNKLLIKHQEFHKFLNSIGDAEENKKIPYCWGILSQAAVVIIAIIFLRQP